MRRFVVARRKGENIGEFAKRLCGKAKKRRVHGFPVVPVLGTIWRRTECFTIHMLEEIASL